MINEDMTTDICVIGAGIVGVTAALELQTRGADVVVVDRASAGRATSYGNAGVLTTSTVLAVNNPQMLRSLPAIVFRRLPYVTYDFWYAISRTNWLLKFLCFGTSRHAVRIAAALHALQKLSLPQHRKYIAEAKADTLLQEKGWLKVYRDTDAYRESSFERELMDAFGIEYRKMSCDEVRELEPGLSPVYETGVLMRETSSLTDPYLLCKAYLELFERRSGRFMQHDVRSIRRSGAGYWIVQGSGTGEIRCRQVVIAAGPWSDDVCRQVRVKVPLAWERGYHADLRSPQVPLCRPVYDVQQGFVMAPQGATTRVTSGVEFAHRDAPPDYTQIRLAVTGARAAASLGAASDSVPWLGARPTLPDSLPMIGPVRRQPGLWLNFGHQHIGVSTAAGSAVLLADQVTGTRATDVDSLPYSPARYGV